jgi:hypothetical protein
LDGFFARLGMFHVMHEVSLIHLEELLRARVINSAQWIIRNQFSKEKMNPNDKVE